MNSLKRIGLLLIVMLACGCAGGRGRDVSVVTAPSGELSLKLELDGPQLSYSVGYRGWQIVERSPIVFTVDGVELTKGVTIGKRQDYKGKEMYETRGVHLWAIDQHRGARFDLKHGKTKYTLDVRAFDDGVAFRLIAPGKKNEQRVPDERTKFVLPAGSTLWYHGMRGHYEGDYLKRNVSIPSNEWIAPPLTAKLPGNFYAAITEANLVNYSGFALEADGERGFAIGLAHRQPVSYPYELRYSKEDIERLSHPAKITGTITTPWRVIIIGRDLNKLVNTDIISNLSPPPNKKLFPDGAMTSWVKPGRAVWQYLDMPSDRSTPGDPLATAPATRESPATTRAATTRSRRQTTPDDMKSFSRLAGELGFEYNIMEGFWSRWTDDEIRDVVKYSKEQGVRLFGWVHSKNLYDPKARAELFKRCRETGIVGLKVDFFDHEHKEVIDLYQALLAEGAQDKLLFDFHGANKPTGESRTWPNEMTREAVRGMEASRMQDRATHNTTLPFTRYVVGPAEYTPMVFGPRRGDTTVAHQIATPIVFTTPLLTYGAHPENILKHPACDLIKSIPATWDQTIVLPGSEIGEAAVFARRKGDTWFLAIINGNEKRTLDVPLTFLDRGTYETTIVQDTDDPASVTVGQTGELRRGNKLTLPLHSGGGFVARFVKKTSGDRK